MGSSASNSILSSVLLATLALATLGGCRADQASKQSSELGARSNADPAPLSAASPSPASSPQPDTTAPVPASSSERRPLLVCFGDSLTAGFGAEPGSSYPDFLQRDLDRAGYHYHVVNQGVSGNTTKDGLERVNHVVALHPALVVVEFGGNDGLRGLPITDSRRNLDSILAALKSSGAEIALAGITLPPDYGPDYIHQFTDTYVVLAKKYHVPLLPFILQGAYGVDGMMQADGIHATARGNEIVAQGVFALVKPLLDK